MRAILLEKKLPQEDVVYAQAPTFNLVRAFTDDLIGIGRDILKRQTLAEPKEIHGKLTSNVDRYAQKKIFALIRRHFKNAGLYGEELSANKVPLETLFERHEIVAVVDPIDGTKFYLAGKDHWATVVAIFFHGKLWASIVLQPSKDEAFLAMQGDRGVLYRKGEGTWHLFTRHRAPRPLTGVSTSASVAMHPGRWNAAGMLTREIQETFSEPTVVMLLEMLRGHYKACVMLHLMKIWDIAGIFLITQQHGFSCIDAESGKQIIAAEDLIALHHPRLIFAETLAAAHGLRWYIAGCT